MWAIMNSLNAHNLTIFQPILTILVSKFMVHRALSDKTYLSLGLLSPLTSKTPCINQAIHVLLMHDFCTLNIRILGRRQK